MADERDTNDNYSSESQVSLILSYSAEETDTKEDRQSGYEVGCKFRDGTHQGKRANQKCNTGIEV